jgi:hypothetical protein
MNKLSRVGIDLAKNVFQLHGVDPYPAIALQLQMLICSVQQIPSTSLCIFFLFLSKPLSARVC